MILCSLRDFSRYEALSSHFGALSDVLLTQDLRELAAGRHDIAGDELYVVAAPSAATQPVVMLEAHRRYIDVHVPLAGTESIGWAPLRALMTEDAPFDIDCDLVKYRDRCLSVHSVTPGNIAVFFPEDAHAPLMGDGRIVSKCVFKVIVDPPTDFPRL